MPISQPLSPTVVVLQTGHADLHTEERTLINEIRARVYEGIDQRSVVGATEIRWTTGAIKDFTLTGATTFSFPSETLVEGGDGGQATSITMRLRQDGTGNRVVTWPASTVLKWAGGTSPSLTLSANREDWLTFITLDAGATWRGFVVAKDVR